MAAGGVGRDEGKVEPVDMKGVHLDSPMRRPGASPSRTDSVEGGSPGPRCGAQAAVST
jgi:hypothetical protein